MPFKEDAIKACEQLDTEQKREYDDYFTRCENSNKFPLSFDEWVKQQRN